MIIYLKEYCYSKKVKNTYFLNEIFVFLTDILLSKCKKHRSILFRTDFNINTCGLI